jgi:hypothetical protein
MLLAPLAIGPVAAGLSARALTAQTDVTIEVGASQIGPPLGLDSESARFAVAGIRASHFGTSGTGAYGALLAGRTLGDANGGDFVTARVGGSLAEQWTSAWRGSLDLRLLAFGVRAPFPYRAVAVELGPAVTFSSGPVSLELAGVAGSGRSRFEVWRVEGGRTRVFEDALAHVGATAELQLGRGTVRGGVAGGMHATPGGRFTSGGTSLVLSGAWGVVELRGDVWRTPAGTQTTGGLSLVVPLSRWSVRGFFGRSDPDPLTLAEPGGASAGVLLGRSLYARGSGGTDDVRPWEILAATDAGARVRMSIEVPAGAKAVALMGDFTLWDPVPMLRRGGRWEVELEIRPGTHHYGFLVDDEWYLPDDTRDVVPDEWGRLSAILVIEGVE